MLRKIRFSLTIILFFLQTICIAQSQIIPFYKLKNFDSEIKFIYQHILCESQDIHCRTEKATHYFLGKKYLPGALGEGDQGQFDKSPLYRTDAFDCVTFVSTVLALVESSSLPEFVDNLKKIQYQNARISYFNRNHFIEADWNAANDRNGFLKDITQEISSYCKTASIFVDKPTWFSHLSCQSLKCFSKLSDEEEKFLLSSLHHHAKDVQVIITKTPFIPLTDLIKMQGDTITINEQILNRIPSATIVEIIDMTKHFREKIGTDLSVVHLGIAIRTANGISFRHASKTHGKVVAVPLAQYLKRYYELTSDPAKVGIHLEKIMP